MVSLHLGVRHAAWQWISLVVESFCFDLDVN
jgi:hypothetical protein